MSTAELTKLQRRQSQKVTKITKNVRLKFLNERCKNVISLGADHLTFDGGGGGWWMILKKRFLQALVGRKKLHAAQMK